MSYTDKQIKFITEEKKSGKSWDEVAEEFNKKFNDNKTRNALKKTFFRYQNFDFGEDNYLANLRAIRTTRRRSSQIAKENRVVLDHLDQQTDLLEEVKDYLKKLKIKKLKIPKYKPSKKKRNMTVEALLSDLHFGKKAKNFNKEIAIKRIQKYVKVFSEEVQRFEKSFNVEKIVVAFIGDLIENATMHGAESLSTCEMSNSEQEVFTIKTLFEEVLLPISMLGRPIHIPCITGNHDREDVKKTYNNPGKRNRSWVIYTLLKMMCDTYGLTNVTFDIPDGVYTHHKIYDDIVLYEHLDEYGKSEKSLNGCMVDRSVQIGKIVTFLRGGHYHDYHCIGRGRIIINGSLGQDSYSDIKGYSGQPTQTINFYVENETRPDSFYHSFPVYLD